MSDIVEKTWYQDFIAELKLHTSIKIVEAHWYRGKRITEETKNLKSLYGKRFVEQIAIDLNIGRSTLFKDIQFYKKYPELSNEIRQFSLEYIFNNLLSSNVHFSSKSSDWCTPQKIIDRTIGLFGKIDLDPCSDNPFQPNVPALNHFSKDDDSLNKEWFGKVYMNPPYGRGLTNWTNKLKQEYETTRVEQAIALIPSRTDTEWFEELESYPRCFIRGRLRFSNQENSAPFPSMIIYMGNNFEDFYKTFIDIGGIYERRII